MKKFTLSLLIGLLLFLLTVSGQDNDVFSLPSQHSTSICLDPSGNPCIAFYDFDNGDLKFASRSSSGAWTVETVQSSGTVGIFCALAIDESGVPHISYYDIGNKNLRYARKSGNSWDLETVDKAGDVGLFSSIAVDSSGRAHIAYCDLTNGNLKYAKRSLNGTWAIGIPDGSGNGAYYTSIRLNSSEQPCIAYHAPNTHALLYAWRVGNSWSSEVVLPHTLENGYEGLYCSLALDSTDAPHIAFMEDYLNGAQESERLKYIKKAGGIWSQPQTIVNDGVFWISLALDQNDRAHISFYDNLNGDLRYAKDSGANWVLEVVESAGNSGECSSIALDSKNRPHISYYKSSTNSVKYANRAGGAWKRKQIYP